MRRALALCCALGVASLAVSARADEDDARRAIPADAAAVLTVHPVAVLGALHRLGSGWSRVVREALHLPAMVNPLDPTLVSALGVDPLATMYASLDLAAGYARLRVAAALADAHLADALVQAIGGAIGAPLARSGKDAWSGKTAFGAMVLARLDGTRLVLDLVRVKQGSPLKAATLLRLVPLRPARAFEARGTASAMGPSDAVALWVDLEAAARIGRLLDELGDAETERAASADARALVVKAHRAELAACLAAEHLGGVTFDDALLALSLRGTDHLAFTAAMGGTRAALAPLRVAPVRPSHTLAASDDPDLRIDLMNAGPLRAAFHRPARVTIPEGCEGSTDFLEVLRRWPALVSTTAEQTRGDATLRALLRVVGGLRGGVGTLLPAEPDEHNVSIERAVLVADLDDAVRGDLDRLFGSAFVPAAPLKVGAQVYSAYSPRVLSSEGPLVVVGPDANGSVPVAFGWRERLHATLDRLTPPPPAMGDAIAHASVSGRGLPRGAMSSDLQSLLDGLEALEATLKLEPDKLQLKVEAALHGTH